MKPRAVAAFIALAVVLAGVFVPLGFWQLDRLAERKAANDRTQQLLSLPAVRVESLQYQSERTNRRVIVEGVPDYEHEFVHTGRSRSGSPGVHVFTPVKTADGRAILVNRGWLYAADAATVELSRWREDRQVFRGYTREMPAGDPTTKTQSAKVRSLSFFGIRDLFAYTVSPLYVVSLDSATERTPVRLPEPDLSNGPHLSYAIQWFCFAAIALIGAGIVLARSRSSGAG